VQSYNYFSDNTTISTFFFITVAFLQQSGNHFFAAFPNIFHGKKGAAWRPFGKACTAGSDFRKIVSAFQKIVSAF